MSIEPKYVELMNADLDGEITEAERIDLQEYLQSNPEAAALRSDLAALCGELDGMARIDPPPHLKYAILDSLQKAKPSRETSPAGGFRWQQIFSAPALRHSLAFAAGAILTFALINSNQISNQAFDDVTGLVGTISETPPPTTGKNSIRLTSSELAGMVNVNAAGSLNVIDFNLTAEGPVEIVAEFSNHELWFKGFAQLENDNTRILAGEGIVRMHTQGRNRYALYLQHTSEVDAPVNFKFYAAGNLIHEASLVISSQGAKND